MEPFVAQLIHEDQSRFIKNCYIRFLSDLIDHCYLEKIPCILLSLDFFKAYDTIEWTFLIKCLEKFNFGSTLIS